MNHEEEITTIGDYITSKSKRGVHKKDLNASDSLQLCKFKLDDKALRAKCDELLFGHPFMPLN